MAQNPGSRRVKPENDVYTALAGIAVAVVAGTLGLVLYLCNDLLGTPFPSFPG